MAMNLMGLVLSWSTINAAQNAKEAGSIILDTKGTEILRMSSRAKVRKPVTAVTTTVMIRATMPLTMLKMLYAY